MEEAWPRPCPPPLFVGFSKQLFLPYSGTAPALRGRSLSLSEVLSDVVLEGLLPFEPRWSGESLADRQVVGEELRESPQGLERLRFGERRRAAA